MKLADCFEFIDGEVEQAKRALVITSNTGKNPVFARVRIDVESEGGGTLTIDTQRGKRMSAKRRRELEELADRQWLEEHGASFDTEPEPEVIDVPGIVPERMFP